MKSADTFVTQEAAAFTVGLKFHDLPAGALRIAKRCVLDGPWGFFQVFGRGFDPEKIVGKFGRPHTIVDPGVSIKPYPCGVLTHPSMDAMLALVKQHSFTPENVAEIILYAGHNILNPIRYKSATNELQAKFCMPFLLSAIVISKRAGVKEFTDEYVNSAPVQAMMRRVRDELARKSPLAVQIAKSAFFYAEDMDYAKQFAYMNEAFARLCTTDDAKEGVAAFFEKRKPIWKEK